MVYLYNKSHDYRMIFESPFTFMWSFLLNDVLFYSVCCIFYCLVAGSDCVAEFRFISVLLQILNLA